MMMASTIIVGLSLVVLVVALKELHDIYRQQARLSLKVDQFYTMVWGAIGSPPDATPPNAAEVDKSSGGRIYFPEGWGEEEEDAGNDSV